MADDPRTRSTGGNPDATTAGATGPAAAGSDACLRCGTQLHSLGPADFRIGGSSGGWKLLFGEWAELGEGMLKLEVRACPACRQVDLRVPG